jgi:acetoin utilization deacetylase AcuC-like enzyme
MIIFHDESCLLYSALGHPERPARIARSVPLLKERHPDWEWRIPKAASEAALLRAHSRDHVKGSETQRVTSTRTRLFTRRFTNTLCVLQARRSKPLGQR